MWQAVRNYLRYRWMSWLFIIVLAVVALWSARVALQTKPKEVSFKEPTVLKHEPDFEATQLKLWRTSNNGQMRMTISGDKVVHYRDDKSSTYDKPKIVLQGKGYTTRVVADMGLMLNDGEQLDLIGNVSIDKKLDTSVRSVNGKKLESPVSFKTERLSFYANEKKISTQTATVFEQGVNVLKAAAGFEYHYDQETITFFGPVRAQLSSSKLKN